MPRIAAGPALPLELTPFIGRASELDELERLAAAGRLLTITGAGGSGKTRLALELMERVAGTGVPVAWVELAPLADGSLIPQHVAEALGVRDEVRGGDPFLALLRGHGGLLVLDNCEHLVDECAALVHGILRECPDLRILATSREALGVKGERAWLAPPLSLPPSSAVGPEEAGGFEAVRLFVERARDVIPEFALTEANAPAVIDICRRLDGIPLAIELAAARVRVLPPEQLRQRLDDAFRLLTAGGRTAVPRHRTLRATIDWSHDLLGDEARVLFRRQAVFRGGFTLDAAEAACAGEGIEAADVLDLVAGLVDRSLLVVHEHQGAARYGPLETVRQYALEKLAESGEEDAVRRRHAHHVLARVEEAAAHAATPRRRAAFDALVPEMDNIREALIWTREHEPATHVRLAGKLGWFWFSVGHWSESRRWVEEALALPAAAAAGLDRAELLLAGGVMASLQTDVEAARPWLEEAIALATAGGDERMAAYAENYLGMTWVQVLRPDGAEHCRRAEAWYREHGDDYGLRLSLLLTGLAAHMEGRPEDAIRLTEESVAVARRFGQDRELSMALQNLATLHLMQGRVPPAEPVALDALAAARRDPSLFFVATTLDVLGEIRLHQQRTVEAGRIFGAAEAIRGLLAARRFEINRRRLEPMIDAVDASPAAGTFRRAWADGAALSMEEILDEVLDGLDAAASPTAGAGDAPVPHVDHAAHLAVALAADHDVDLAADHDVDLAADLAADLAVSALGPLEVAIHGQPMPPDAWTYAKPKELLVYLLLHPAGRTRDQIGRSIWPGASAAQVKNSFHVTLHHLRRTLGGAEWVIIDGDRYRLSPSIRTDLDAERFEREARQALAAGVTDADRLGAILALYRGDLLEGEVTGAWVDEHRDRLRRVMVDLGLAYGMALAAAGDPGAAADVYRALAIREELNEEVQRRLMLAWAEAGDRVRALRHYERLVDLLRDELDAEPEPETVSVYEKLRIPVVA